MQAFAWNGDVNLYSQISYNILASLHVGGKGAVHLLNRIDTVNKRMCLQVSHPAFTG